VEDKRIGGIKKKDTTWGTWDMIANFDLEVNGHCPREKTAQLRGTKHFC
jgi:hypothetical protein